MPRESYAPESRDDFVERMLKKDEWEWDGPLLVHSAPDGRRIECQMVRVDSFFDSHLSRRLMDETTSSSSRRFSRKPFENKVFIV